MKGAEVENKRPGGADAESASDPPHLSRRIEFWLLLRCRGICAVTAASTQAGDCQGGFAVGLVIRRQVVSGLHFPRPMLTEAPSLRPDCVQGIFTES